MLQTKHLTIRHKKDYRILLEDFNFHINSGDKCALIGEEGNGKRAGAFDGGLKCCTYGAASCHRKRAD